MVLLRSPPGHSQCPCYAGGVSTAQGTDIPADGKLGSEAGLAESIPHSSCRTSCKASRGTHLAESQRLQVQVVSLALGAGIGDHDGDRALGGVSIAAPLQAGEGSRA